MTPLTHHLRKAYSARRLTGLAQPGYRVILTWFAIFHYCRALNMELI